MKRSTIELLAGLALVALTTLVFWVTDWDQAAQRPLYAGGENPWPVADAPLCQFFYYSAPVLAGVLGLGSLGFWVGARFKPSWRPWRRYATYLFLCMALGPGLVINAIFKDYSGRPRPRQTEEFGGAYQHLRPFETGKIAAGKSFPCGHASVGYVYVAGYFLLRRKRPRLAWGILLGSLVFGGLMGWCRMAAGGHFLSDVIMAFAMTFLVCHLTYYHLLKIPRWESLPRDASPPRHFTRLEAAGYGVFGLACGFVLLLAYPYYNRLDKPWPDSAMVASEPIQLIVVADRGTVTFVFDQPERHLDIEAEVHGFGLPEKSVQRTFEIDQGTMPVTLRYAHTTRGVFTEFEGRLVFYLDPARVRTVDAREVTGLVVVEGLPDAFAGPQLLLPETSLRRWGQNATLGPFKAVSTNRFVSP